MTAQKNSFFVLRKAVPYIVALAFTLTLMPNMAVAGADSVNNKSETLGFALTWFGIANHEGKDDCPKGLAKFPSKDDFLAASTEQQRKKLTDPKSEGLLYYTMAMRGPGGLNVCDHPETVVEPLLNTVEGNTAYGLNLTAGNDSLPVAAKSCAQQKFVNGLNGEDGVDNQYYRVNGCQFGLRNDGPGGYITKFRSGVMLDGNYTILIDVSGVDDRKNDDEVIIGIYQGQDPVVRDAAGVGVLSDASLRVVDERLYHSVMKGKIENGVILSTERKDVYLVEKTEAALAAPSLHFRDARIRIEVDDAGNFNGILAGYHDWLPLYRSVSKALSFGEISAGFSCPALYEAYKRLADGYPDPKTGECTAVSIAYIIKGIPAYVIHPKGKNSQGVKP